jgi:hypothetical protein
MEGISGGMMYSIGGEPQGWGAVGEGGAGRKARHAATPTHPPSSLPPTDPYLHPHLPPCPRHIPRQAWASSCWTWRTAPTYRPSTGSCCWACEGFRGLGGGGGGGGWGGGWGHSRAGDRRLAAWRVRSGRRQSSHRRSSSRPTRAALPSHPSSSGTPSPTGARSWRSRPTCAPCCSCASRCPPTSCGTSTTTRAASDTLALGGGHKLPRRRPRGPGRRRAKPEPRARPAPPVWEV